MSNTSYCATIGFFDGVHRGHQFLIRRLVQMARDSGQQSLVITFDRHPRQVVHSDYVPQLITPLDEKLRLLRATPADRVEVLHFDAAMAGLTARDFMQRVLHEKLGVDTLLIGYDNRFGHNRSEGFDDYVEYGKEIGIKVVKNDAFDIDGMRVSSSLVRKLLMKGDVAAADNCLGHNFSIEGRVEHGFQEGRKLGFPTANIAPQSAEQLLPEQGVYVVRVSVDGGAWQRAVMNVGNNPTFARHRLTLEAHIFDFDGDLYGKTLRTEFLWRLRGERHFASIDELRSQLIADSAEAKRMFDAY